MADAKMKKGTYTVRNIAPGVRGFHDANDGYVELEPNGKASEVRFSEAEFESALKTRAFEITASGDEPASDDDDQADTPDGAKAYADITGKDIKAHLDTAGVSYETDANKTALYALYTATFEKPGAGTNPTDAANNAPPGDTLDKATDADLRDIVKGLTGEEPPADADRETLLKLARGEE